MCGYIAAFHVNTFMTSKITKTFPNIKYTRKESGILDFEFYCVVYTPYNKESKLPF